jgi:hypothetical protein
MTLVTSITSLCAKERAPAESKPSRSAEQRAQKAAARTHQRLEPAIGPDGQKKMTSATYKVCLEQNKLSIDTAESKPSHSAEQRAQKAAARTHQRLEPAIGPDGQKKMT